MIRRVFILSVFTWLTLSGCGPDETMELSPSAELNQLLAGHGGPEAFLLPEPDDLSAIPQDPRNPLTEEKVRLGQLLFHETGIGLSAVVEGRLQTYSCASCHAAQAGFQAGRLQGIGEGGEGFGFRGERRAPAAGATDLDLDVQPIRSPTALNSAYQEVMLWNGQFGATGPNAGTESSWTVNTPKETNWLGFQGLEIQAIAGLGVHRMLVNEDIVDSLGYRQLFDAAFPDRTGAERYDLTAAGLAIAAYERTLLANEAPFQRYLRGNTNALTQDELRGATLFFGKADCVSCHSGPALSSMSFHALGMSDLVDCPEETFRTTPDNIENLGRGGFTLRAEDNYRFKTPQLYSTSRSPFYGHGASFRSLREVVAYKNEAVAQNSRVPAESLSPQFRPLNLTDEEIDQLTAFLEKGLDDARLRRYVPTALPSGACFPNADPDSRDDLGCY